MASNKKSKKNCPLDEDEGTLEVWVSWEYTSATGGGICEGQEDDSYPNHEPEHKEHEVLGIFTSDSNDRGWSTYSERLDVEFEPTPGNTAFLVVVTYQTGCTFGYSTGNVSIVDVFDSEEEADKTARAIREGTFPGQHHDWTGYFESLEGIDVQRFVLDESSGIKRF
jgi:hypothetical protein